MHQTSKAKQTTKTTLVMCRVARPVSQSATNYIFTVFCWPRVTSRIVEWVDVAPVGQRSVAPAVSSAPSPGQLLLCERRGASAPAESFPSSGGDSQRETHNGNKSRLEMTSEANKHQQKEIRAANAFSHSAGAPPNSPGVQEPPQHNLDTP